nr:PREDICTED: focal adhesion kinase 1-like [Balearica regulorum gibbericeps]
MPALELLASATEMNKQIDLDEELCNKTSLEIRYHYGNHSAARNYLSLLIVALPFLLHHPDFYSLISEYRLKMVVNIPPHLIDNEGEMAGNQHIYQPVGKPDHAAPPKKPPRPGAPSHLGSLASLNSPVDSYNEGVKIQPQEISPPPTANLDRSNDKVYENVTGLVKAVIEMSSKIQPAPPEEYVPMVKEVGLALRTLLATVDETLPVLPASTHREIEMAQKLLNSDLAELINKMKLAQQYVMTSLQQEYKKQMLTAAHALAVDAKNLLDVIDQARLKMISQSRPH